MKSDQEPAIRALLQPVKNERAEEINIQKRVELVPEKSPASESRANGEIELSGCELGPQDVVGPWGSRFVYRWPQ